MGGKTAGHLYLFARLAVPLLAMSLLFSCGGDESPAAPGSTSLELAAPYNQQPMTDAFFRTTVYGSSPAIAFNPDGTRQDNPVIRDTAAENGAGNVSGGIVYYLYKLRDNGTITFDGQPYTVYSAVPENMHADYAYQKGKLTTYYDAEGLKRLAIDAATVLNPSTVKQGQKSVLDGSDVLTASTTLNRAGSGNRIEPYLPLLTSASTPSMPLMDHVVWQTDPYVNHAGYTHGHIFQYGWVLDPRKVTDTVVWVPIAADGGGQAGGWIRVEDSSNYLKTMIGLKKSSVDTLLSNPLLKVMPYPLPVYLYQGAFLPLQPQPGFQRNLVRKNTPWGTICPLSGTSDLFIRQNGEVEIPAYQVSLERPGRGTGDGGSAPPLKPYPLVLQSWADNTVVILNSRDKAVPSAVTSYPGDEVYYLGNTYLPGKAGIPPTISRDYNVIDASNLSDPSKVSPRAGDGFLGLLGDAPSDVMQWDLGGGADQGEPGAQMNKPYMMNVFTYRDATFGNKTVFTVMQSNSFWLVRGNYVPPEKMYGFTIYYSLNHGPYQKWATLSYEKLALSFDRNVSGAPVWQNAQGDTYWWLPRITTFSSDANPYVKDFGLIGDHFEFAGAKLEITAYYGSNWLPTDQKMAGWAFHGDLPTAINQKGSHLYRYLITANTGKGDVRFLIRIE